MYSIENKLRTYNKRNMMAVFIVVSMMVVALFARLSYLMINRANYYGTGAIDVHERERKIKARRGEIYDRDGVVLASNKSVCTISVIHNQIKEPSKVISVLSQKLNISKEEIKRKVEKYSSIEKIKSNVEKKVADEIRNMNMAGVMVDEDYKRVYPHNVLASKVLGFTGSDNQGILGLEVKYNELLKGKEGRILTTTTASGIELDREAERRIEPEAGKDLVLTIDYDIQKYVQQMSYKILMEKKAKSVKMVIMNPKNGEIYAMVDAPEYNLNEPYKYREWTYDKEDIKNKIIEDNDDGIKNENNKMDTNDMTNTQEKLNEMWRNKIISDTYEPGSTYKMVTATAAFEEGVLDIDDSFSCPGYRVVEDRRIRCHQVRGHGNENFKEGIMNSCNPVFIDVGLRLTPKKMYEYYRKLGLFNKTGIDVPGEASSIMHKLENIKSVELATMSFGQSIQITPLQLLVAASAIVNGGELVKPHFVKEVRNEEGEKMLLYDNNFKELVGDNVKKETQLDRDEMRNTEKTKVISKETSEKMKSLLEAVVAEGTGSKAYVEGLRIGGKTATSEKLPRRTGRYISSFIGFMPANDPNVIGIVLIDEPVGLYYGGTIAAPIIADVFKNIANNGNSGLIMLE